MAMEFGKFVLDSCIRGIQLIIFIVKVMLNQIIICGGLRYFYYLCIEYRYY